MGHDTLLTLLTRVGRNYSGCFPVATLFAAVLLGGTAVSAQTARVGDLHARAESGEAEAQLTRKKLDAQKMKNEAEIDSAQEEAQEMTLTQIIGRKVMMF